VDGQDRVPLELQPIVRDYMRRAISKRVEPETEEVHQCRS
jgi:hypothetical protein